MWQRVSNWSSKCHGHRMSLCKRLWIVRDSCLDPGNISEPFRKLSKSLGNMLRKNPAVSELEMFKMNWVEGIFEVMSTKIWFLFCAQNKLSKINKLSKFTRLIYSPKRCCSWFDRFRRGQNLSGAQRSARCFGIITSFITWRAILPTMTVIPSEWATLTEVSSQHGWVGVHTFISGNMLCEDSPG